MLSIALQFGSVAEAVNADVLNVEASRNATVGLAIEFCSYRRSRHDPPLVTQEGRSPVQIGRASHSEQRIRRSSPPTLTKTKGASSRPVFKPMKIAGTP